MKEDFKRFIKANPKLINYVNDKKGTWQNLYEIYTLYGEDENIWKEYITDKNNSIDDLIKMFKNINLENVKNTVDGLQKVIGIIQDLTKDNKEEQYIPNRKYNNLDD